MAQRITGVCVSPGATWEPLRAARQLSGSPVSNSTSLQSQTEGGLGFSSTNWSSHIVEGIIFFPLKILFLGGEWRSFMLL